MIKYFSIIIMLATVIYLTVGFSSLSKDLLVSDVIAHFRLPEEIRVTGFSASSQANSGQSSWDEYNTNIISAGVILPNQNSTVTYRVEVTNLSSRVVQIGSITNLPSNITYELSGYTLGEHICNNDQCNLGVQKEFYITFKYKSGGYNSSNTSYIIDAILNWSFNYTVTFNANGGNPPSFPDSLVTLGGTYGTLPTVTRDYYTFEGWYDAASGGNLITSSTEVTIEHDHSIFAHWIPNIYTITLNNVSADTSGTTEVYMKYDVGYYSDSGCTTPITSITIPTKRGHTFNGYYIFYGNDTPPSQIIDSNGLITVNARRFGANYTITADYVTNQYSCASGQYLPANAVACATCEAGGYCPSAGTYGFNATTDQGRTVCPGSMTSAAGSDEITDCKITCAATKYLAAGGSTCSDCTAGYYCPSSETYYYNTSTAQGRTQCVAGTYATTGQSACSVCGSGKTSTAGTTASTNCTNCAAITGSINWATPTWDSSNNTVANLCKSSECDAGYRLENGTCYGCGPGTYSVFSGVTSCSSCDYGSYSTGSANSSCIACGGGLTTASTGSTSSSSCIACTSIPGLNTWADSEWGLANNRFGVINLCKAASCNAGYRLSSGTCTGCGAGTFSASAGATSCTNCAQGSYSTGNANTGCTACTAGNTTSGTGATASSSCTACTAITGSTGWATQSWSNNTVANLCTSSGCSAGYILNSGTCTGCGAGTYSLAGATSCTACAIGSISTDSANASCTACTPSGATGTGGTTSDVGQSSCNTGCGKSNVASWNTPSWNNNSPTNICSIATCKDGYKVSSNSCVVDTKSVTIYGTPSDKITINFNGSQYTTATIGDNGQISATVPKTSSTNVSFVSSVTGTTRSTTTSGISNVYFNRYIYKEGTFYYSKESASSWTLKTSPSGYTVQNHGFSAGSGDSRKWQAASGALYDSNGGRHGYILGTTSKVRWAGYDRLRFEGYTTINSSSYAYYFFGFETNREIVGSQPDNYGGYFENIPVGSSSDIKTKTYSIPGVTFTANSITSVYVVVAIIGRTSSVTTSYTTRVYNLFMLPAESTS